MKEAVKHMKIRKAPGIDNIQAELLKADIGFATIKVKEITERVFWEERMPGKWRKGLIDNMPKRGNLAWNHVPSCRQHGAWLGKLWLKEFEAESSQNSGRSRLESDEANELLNKFYKAVNREADHIVRSFCGLWKSIQFSPQEKPVADYAKPWYTI